MRTVDFKFSTLVRIGLAVINGAKWDADLVDWHTDSPTDVYLASLSSPISDDNASRQSSSMFYYSHFKGQGRDSLAEALGVDDPFKMLPYELVERVLARGEPPKVDSWQANLWRDAGQVYEVRLAKRNYLVAISASTEEINVQEMRTDPYPELEGSLTLRRAGRRPRLATCKPKTSRNAAFPGAIQTAMPATC